MVTPFSDQKVRSHGQARRRSGQKIVNQLRPLLSAVLGRTKFWTQKPRIIEV